MDLNLEAAREWNINVVGDFRTFRKSSFRKIE